MRFPTDRREDPRQDKTNFDSELKRSGVNVVDVSTSTTLELLRVYYSNSSSVLTMGIERSLYSMQKNLFDHLFNLYGYGQEKSNGTRDGKFSC